LNRSPLLEGPAGPHQVLAGKSGPFSGNRFTKDIGGLLPIAQFVPNHVPVSTPSITFSHRVVETQEPLPIQTLGPDHAVEAFDERTFGRLARPV